MKFLITLLLIFYFQHQETDAVKIVWDNTVEFDPTLLDQRFTRAEEVRIPNWLFIFPGTKWCGAGNIADNEDDLGVLRNLDKCCRTHDHCPDIIEGWQTGHGLTNPNFWTRLNCTCDQEFFECLKSVNDFPSKQVGNVYFNFLGTQCFREDYPIVSCKKYSSILPTLGKCLEYELDTTQPKEYQFFDVPIF